MTSLVVIRAFLFSRPSTGKVDRCGDADDKVALPFIPARSSATVYCEHIGYMVSLTSSQLLYSAGLTSSEHHWVSRQVYYSSSSSSTDERRLTKYEL